MRSASVVLYFLLASKIVASCNYFFKFHLKDATEKRCLVRVPDGTTFQFRHHKLLTIKMSTK
jgi:hypothetical protein